jgi:hypothetical protein
LSYYLKTNKGDIILNQKYNLIDFLRRYNNDVTEMEFFKILKHLPELAEKGPWLAGGAVRRLLIGDPLTSDFDFFFHDETQLNEFAKALKDKGAKETAKTEHQITYSLTIEDKPRIIQLIKIGYYISPNEVLDSFDFTISQFLYDGTNLYCGTHSLWDLARRRLALHKLTFGVATMRRLIKYTKQGFTACAGVMQSILEAVVNDPKTINSDVQYLD